MSWIFYALVGPILWSVVNYCDRYFLSKFFKGKHPGSAVVFTSIAAFFVALFILITHPQEIGLVQGANRILMLLNGGLFVVAFIPYCYAILKDDVSVVAPLFQAIPFFGYLFGAIFLNEHLALIQIFAGLLIIGGSLVLITGDHEGKFKINKQVFWLMMASSFMTAFTLFLFKFVAIQDSFWSTGFWEYTGMFLLGVLLFIFLPGYRKDIIATYKANPVTSFSFATFTEILNIIAKLAGMYASLFVPLALVMIVNGVQPFILFIFGIILTVFFPTIAQENISKKHIVRKIIGIVIMFIGVYLLFHSF